MSFRNIGGNGSIEHTARIQSMHGHIDRLRPMTNRAGWVTIKVVTNARPRYKRKRRATFRALETIMDQKNINRIDGRSWDALRPVVITPDFIPSAAGSCLIACGNTRVICTASVDEKVPPFLENAGLGWLTAEYSMLPASASSRMTREKVAGSGRTYEIQRLIGRSLRAALDRKKLGLRTITIDCDVIQADGGTRTASVTGGFVALSLAIRKLLKNGTLAENPIIHQVAAVSLGKVSGDLLLDLNFVEDSSADIDANLVATPDGELIEWQTTAERALLPLAELPDMTALGMKGIRELAACQRQAIGDI